MKPRILFVTEFSQLPTGYGVIGRELISRLYSTGKYDIAEFSSYVHFTDVRIKNVPWKVYSTFPTKGNVEDEHLFNSNPVNQFGAHRFEEVLLDFKPTHVCSWRDYWMDSYICSSPFRKCYKQIWMPTCDSEPQEEHWMADYIQCDGILAYSDWGAEVLKRQSGNKINYLGVGPSGVSFNDFSPIQNRDQHRQQFGIDPSANIIGTVMRNQKRKLFNEIMESFNALLNKYERYRNNTFLYFHTTYPDNGWDIPKLLKDYGLGNKVLFTYLCANCHYFFPSFFIDARATCPRCGTNNAILPNQQTYLDGKNLSAIYNLFDLYVQYAICLGKNEEILTKNGWKKISDVLVNDEVFTHKNRYKKVIQTFKNLTKNHDVYQITPYALTEKLIITDGHPALAYTSKILNNKTQKSVREYLGRLIQRNQTISEPEFIDITELQIGDLLCCAIDDTIEDITKINLNDYHNNLISTSESDLITVKHSCKEYNSLIDIDNEFCRFIGLFAADGCAADLNLIKITSNINEDKNIELSKKILTLLTNNFSNRIYKDRNAIDIYGNSSLHQKIFLKWFAKNEYKQLPDWTLHLPVDKQKEILIGLFMGDGSFNQQKNISSYRTISKKLTEQIIFLLRRQRINFNISLINKNCDDGCDRKLQYNIDIYGDIQNGDLSTVRNSSRNCYLNNYHLVQIKNIEKIDYQDDVYNLEVEEDNSYTTKIGSLHNCEGQGIPPIEAAACGVPSIIVNYSAMCDYVEKLNSIPVEIGKAFLECESHAYRVYPDNEQLTKEINNFFSSPKFLRYQHGFSARQGVENHYNWDKIAKVWEDAVDSLPIVPLHEGWGSQPNIHQFQGEIPNIASNEQFVRWAIINILNEPKYLDSHMALRMVRDLNYGAYLPGYGGLYLNENSLAGTRSQYQPFTRDSALNKLQEIRNVFNYWEQRRIGKIKESTKEFISAANRK